MYDYADLEIDLRRAPHAGAGYQIWARLRRPNEDRLPRSELAEVAFDVSLLKGVQSDTDHGRELSGIVFCSKEMKELFRDALKSAQDQAPPVPLRLRLAFDADAAELLGLRWEALCDPDSSNFLATDENILLSRLLHGPSDRTVYLPQKAELKALAVIASPADIDESYGNDDRPLAPVVVDDERSAIEARLSGFHTTWLCQGGDGKPTLGDLMARLHEGFDVLYMVCHGQLEDRGPDEPPAAKIWLEQDDGSTDIVYAEDQIESDGNVTEGLAKRLRNLTRRPRLVVLASCQSAGDAYSRAGGALAAFGPKLVEAGVPAVLAMQGDITMETVAAFMPRFFEVLMKTGEIDRAMAAARGHISGCSDWTAPVLFMLLESGRLFDESGSRAPFMAGDLVDFVPRPVLLRQTIDLLVDGTGQPRATVAALHGPGGFGKSTLARAVCHEPGVRRAFADGVLWTTLGEAPDVRAGLTELCAALSGVRQNFGSDEAAGLELARQLAGKHCLLVIDDVWSDADLRPFLQGGPSCARLITTRDLAIAAKFTSATGARIPVEEMTLDEAIDMLAAGVNRPLPNRTAFEALAGRLGRWPLLLELVGATKRLRLEEGDTLDGALAYVNQALDEEGVEAFDSRNAEERDKAVSLSINASLKPLKTDEKADFFELAIFPRDTNVPLAVVGQLWELSPFKTQRQSEIFSHLALLKFDLRTNTIRLHSVMRDYLTRKLVDPAAHHLRLIASWGDALRLSLDYAWDWYAYHLAEAARAEESLDQARHLVDTVLAEEYQDAHLAARHDPAALVADAMRAVETLAGRAVLPSWPLEPKAASLLVRAALGHVYTRQERLAPEHLFVKAKDGDLRGAESYLGLFPAEREWQQACQLICAWLAPQRSAPEANAIHERVCKDPFDGDVLPLLAERVRSILARTPWTVGPLPTTVDYDRVSIIIKRMPGLKDALGLPAEIGANLSESIAVDPTISSYAASVRMTAEESAELVGYAVQHPDESQSYLDDHLAILAANSYARYRNRFLWPFLRSVLWHPEPNWAQSWAVKVAVAALSPSKLEFHEGVPILALALQARAGMPGVQAQLDAYRAAVEDMAKVLVNAHGRGDAWGSYTRRLAALALAYRMLEQMSAVEPLLTLGRRIQFGFAGFQSPAWLSLAESALVCDGVNAADLTARLLDQARTSAVNVQDVTFCAQTTARWNAMKQVWWETSLNALGVLLAAAELRQSPESEHFAALHCVDEMYAGRHPETGRVPEARTLRNISALYGRPLTSLKQLHPGVDPDMPLPDGQLIAVPDPELVPLIAARLAADALVVPDLSPHARVAVIQSLVPVAVSNPTALDTVLTRLLFAAERSWGAGIGAEVAGLFGDIPSYLWEHLEKDRYLDIQAVGS